MEKKVVERKKGYTLFSKASTQKSLEKNKYIASGAHGNIYKYCLSNSKCLVVKKSYIDKRESKHINNQFDIKAFKHNVFIEYASMQLTNQLVLQKICPNFGLNYNHIVKERIGVCSDEYPYKSLLYNELIDGESYDKWVRKEHSTKEFYNAYFQIMAAVHSLQKYLNMVHLDLHSKNILVTKVKKGGYWKYKIDDTDYYIPNMGYIFYIIDFDQAWIPGTFKSWFIKEKYNKNKIHKGFDIMFLFRSTLHFSKSTKTFKDQVRTVINKLRKNEGFSDVMYDMYGKIFCKDNLWKHLRPADRHHIETYNLNKRFKKQSLPAALRFIPK